MGLMISKLFSSGICSYIFSKLFPSDSMKPPSLANMGVNCYLNSALQGLSACTRFVEDIKQLLDERKEANSEVGLKQLYRFTQLIDILNGCSTTSMNITRDPVFRNWDKPGQQDSYGLLAHVLNEVYNELRKHLEDTGKLTQHNLNEWLNVSLPMRLTFHYDVKGGCDKTTKNPIQSDLALHIPIPTHKGSLQLNDLVDAYFDGNTINDYECSKVGCNCNVATRFAKLHETLPNTICIHLQRSVWNGSEMIKINEKVQFQPELTIKPQYRDGDENQWNDEPYRLVSVIVHSGNYESGHYICYKMLKNDWFYTSDSYIHITQEKEVLGCHPYILFYEKEK